MDVFRLRDDLIESPRVATGSMVDPSEHTDFAITDNLL